MEVSARKHTTHFTLNRDYEVWYVSGHSEQGKQVVLSL